MKLFKERVLGEEGIKEVWEVLKKDIKVGEVGGV